MTEAAASADLPAFAVTAAPGDEGAVGEAQSRAPGLTPSQTVGPFFHYALTPAGQYAFPDLVTGWIAPPEAEGARVRVEGQVTDGNGEAVPDAMVEVWGADGEGRYGDARANTGFTGFGRVALDGTGHFAFETLRPGRVPGPEGTVQAPHLNLGLFSRGLLRRLFTRLYFEDEAEANAADPVLALVPEARRGTLIARRQERPGSAEIVYRLDIRLQGEGETVFLEVGV